MLRHHPDLLPDPGELPLPAQPQRVRTPQGGGAQPTQVRLSQ